MPFNLSASQLYSIANDTNAVCGLQNYWPFDGNTNDVANNKNMTYGGQAVAGLVNSRRGDPLSAMSFKGGYFVIPPGRYFNGDFTFSVWFLVRSFDHYARIVDLINPFTFIIAILNDGRIHVILDPNQNTRFASSYYFTPNTWHHISFVMQQNSVFLYINGTASSLTGPATTNVYNTPGDSNSNYLGKSNWNNDPLFNGIIDSLKIFNLALSPAEVLKNFNLSLTQVNMVPVDPCQTKVCGIGAQCIINSNGQATCSCQSGKTGDPEKRCCGRSLCFSSISTLTFQAYLLS